MYNPLGWGFVLNDEAKFGVFFSKVIDMLLNKEVTLEQFPVYIAFFKYAFRVTLLLFVDL